MTATGASLSLALLLPLAVVSGLSSFSKLQTCI
jgi:hypothetical protein